MLPPKTFTPQAENLYVWDGERTSVADEFVIMELPDGQRRNVDTYLHGYCQLMALALHKVTGLPLGVLVHEGAYLDDGGNPMDALGHAYCVMHREGMEPLVLDARGFREHGEMLAEYGDEFDFSEVHGQEATDFLKDWMTAGLLKDFDPHEEAALIAYAQRLKDLGVFHAEQLTDEEVERVESFEQPSQSWQSPFF
ncbi:hypothetical protein [Pseudomonas amygdali]|uniref:Uncharacterized protein n=2 Tax=Pseudomonas amygdali pv. lachrymans TaxID=53707 RepID=A0ABR5KQY8_PSEAV|nr:hypothetical protein [Pseudomonas amygdali]AXH59806.1 hypothetical protein PLA107_031780 [Pseudomonas amygdali pv. lachrymans str. M301315]KPC17226.1 Uncharacterized protein AC499_0428 [Pseudomonas amygdali pv. lachrymans]KPC18185.1 Uncharacterized protein AC499_1387 [Pseudomonas amygdali pv. lachrymans]RMT06254.1 hypothetical protein ALP54_03693 [Pseudomonas amygdali pv. lachrymans]